jgi:hypothetical protein
VTSEYHVGPGLLLRALGVLLGAAGLVLLLVAVLVGVLGWPHQVLTVTVVAAVAVVVATSLAGLWAGRRVSVVRLDDDGYRVRLLRGAGTRQARWRDIEDVVTARVAGTDAVVVRLRDGRTTTVPVVVLAAPPGRFVDDLRSHLDRAHGYRRLR